MVPLRPIWTIMVGAKLDRSRVLVTKFHQNQSTLKGRSASQIQTDRQTDRQTRLKIMALQVCSPANTIVKLHWHELQMQFAFRLCERNHAVVNCFICANYHEVHQEISAKWH